LDWLLYKRILSRSFQTNIIFAHFWHICDIKQISIVNLVQGILTFFELQVIHVFIFSDFIVELTGFLSLSRNWLQLNAAFAVVDAFFVFEDFSEAF
jgi:hypothetical protein